MSSKKQKRAVEKSGAKQAELKKSLTTVRAQLSGTEKKLAKAKVRTDHWKAEAKTSRAEAARSADQLEKLRKRLDKATTTEPATKANASEETSSPEPTTEEAAPAAEMTDTAVTPDESWTVVQLRAEAKAQGLAGMSNKPKATLLEALS